VINIVRNEIRDKQVYRCTDKISSDKEYFLKVLRIFSAAFLDYEFHLTDRESDLVYGVYECISNGDRSILKKENIDKYFSSFKEKKVIQVWLNRVEKKGWVSQSNGEYYIEGEFEKLVQFNITGFTIDLIRDAFD
jgi:hypothetical protein